MLFRTHRRLLAAAILLAFTSAWVLPVQACLAAEATAQASCPDCTSPCCDQDRCCCGTVAATCASMVPASVVAIQPLGKAAPAAAIQAEFPHSAAPSETAFAPHARPPAFPSPSSLNIRFCRFKE